jgi:hypothetical protein
MNWIKTVRDVYAGIKVGIHHGKFREMLELDRDTACKGIADAVEQMTPAELDVFEREFLTHGMNVVGHAHRLRAMELYAYLKVKETQHCGQFSGFKSSGEAITSESPIWNGLRNLQRLVGPHGSDGHEERVES